MDVMSIIKKWRKKTVNPDFYRKRLLLRMYHSLGMYQYRQAGTKEI